MIGILLAKDLQRARRNPTPWLVNLAMPLVITALIGLAFAPGAGGGGLGRIRIALVDEDHSVLTRLLRNALDQREMENHLEIRSLDRAEATRQLTDSVISAALIIPAGFTGDYLSGRTNVTLELIKNPAQTFHPAIVEELLGVLVTALNSVAQPLRQEFPAWQAALDRPGGPDWAAVSTLIQGIGTELESARAYLFPPLIRYHRESRSEPVTTGGPQLNLFAYLLPGLTAMFLLFIADNAVRDLYREGRFGTLARFRTIRQDLFGFVVAKALFALVVLAIAAMILLGGGSWLFGFTWRRPLALSILCVGYAFFAAGLMALIAGLAGKERRADLLNTVLAMGLGLAGGCMFPAEQLPGILRNALTPYMPTRWFILAVHGLQSGTEEGKWLTALAGLFGLGLAGLWFASVLFARRFERGVHS